MFDTVFRLIGQLVVLYLVFKLFRFFHMILTDFVFPTYPDFSKYGKWSVVTGCTGGIGKAFAFELASRGQNIILISRNEEKLQQVSKEIVAKHGVETRCLQVDFSDDEPIYDVIQRFLRDFDIGVLVNNVGIEQPLLKFVDIPDLSSLIHNITKLNILSVFKMHQIVLPRMVRKRKGIIINLSSASCVLPFSGYQTYGATKAFVDYFSRALSYEYENEGIIVQSLRPFYLRTDMLKRVTSKWQSYPEPEPYVRRVLATIGKRRATHGDLHHIWKGIRLRLVPTNRLQSRLRSAAEAAALKLSQKLPSVLHFLLFCFIIPEVFNSALLLFEEDTGTI